MTYDAVVAAYDEAMEWINADKKRAAQFYLDISKEKMSLEDLTQILLAPDYVFGKTPHRIGSAMEMMHKAGHPQEQAAVVEGHVLPRGPQPARQLRPPGLSRAQMRSSQRTISLSSRPSSLVA